MIARIALVAAVASEGLAFYTVAEWFAAGYQEGEHHAVHGIVFVAIALIAFFVPRFIQSLDLRPRVATTLMAIVAYVTIYGVIRWHFAGDFAIWDLSWLVDFVKDPGATLEGQSPLLVGTLLIVSLWGRSAYRSSTDVELENLPKAVGIPFIVVTSVLVLSVYTERSGEVARAGAAYYFVAVLALAMGQLSLSGASFGDVRAGGTVATLILGTVGVAVACVFVFWLVFGLIGPIIGPALGHALFVTLTVILTPVAWLFDAVFSFLLVDLAGLDNVQLPTPGDIQDTAETNPDDEPNAVQKGGVYATRILMLLVALGLIALVIAWLTRLRRRGGRTGLDGEATGIAGAFQDDVRSLFGSMFRRSKRDSGVSGTTAMRQLYVQVLGDAAAKGVERQPDETPTEIAPRLTGTYHNAVTDEITAAFLQSRYAGREPDPRTVADLEQRWRQSRSPG